MTTTKTTTSFESELKAEADWMTRDQPFFDLGDFEISFDDKKSRRDSKEMKKPTTFFSKRKTDLAFPTQKTIHKQLKSEPLKFSHEVEKVSANLFRTKEIIGIGDNKFVEIFN